MAIKRSSAKAKGMTGQKYLAGRLRDHHPSLTEDDVRSCSSGSNGADILMSSAAKQLIPFEWECKVRASGFTPVYDAIEQAARHGTLTPVAWLRQDHRKGLIVMREEDWFKLAFGGKE